MWTMMQDAGMGWGMGFGMLWGVLFLVLVIAGVVALVGWLGGRGSERTESALDIPKKRYARGEISREDFDRMKRELG